MHRPILIARYAALLLALSAFLLAPDAGAAELFGGLNEAGLNAEEQIANQGFEERENPEGFKSRFEPGNVTPPDTAGAIGSKNYVESVNNEIAVYSRANLKRVAGPVTLRNFIDTPLKEEEILKEGKRETIEVKAAVTDPQIKYDPATKRWFYVAVRTSESQIEINPESGEVGVFNELYVGFSKTDDPTNLSTEAGGGWCGYKFTTDEYFEDFPKLGVDELHIIIGANSYKQRAPNAGFATARIFSLPKPRGPIAGACPGTPPITEFPQVGKGTLTTSIEGHKAFGPEPATVVGGGTENGYVVAADQEEEKGRPSGKGKNIMIWQVAGRGNAPRLVAIGAPAALPYELSNDAPQPKPSPAEDLIDTSDVRLESAISAPDPSVRDIQAVWTEHTIRGGAGAAVRWYELLPKGLKGSSEVRQQGTVAGAKEYDFNGAVAPTLAGGAVLNYDHVGLTENAAKEVEAEEVEIQGRSRLASTAAGVMNGPITIDTSEAIDSEYICPSEPLGKALKTASCRWGDYASASIDPNHGSVVCGSSQDNGPIGKEKFAENAAKERRSLGHDAQWATQNFCLTPEPNPFPLLWTDSSETIPLRSVEYVPKNQPDALEFVNSAPFEIAYFGFPEKGPFKSVTTTCSESEIGATVLVNNALEDPRLALPFGVNEGDGCEANGSKVATYFDAVFTGALGFENEDKAATITIRREEEAFVAEFHHVSISQNIEGAFCTAKLDGAKATVENVTKGFMEESPPNMNLQFSSKDVFPAFCIKAAQKARGKVSWNANFFLETPSTTTDTAFIGLGG